MNYTTNNLVMNQCIQNTTQAKTTTAREMYPNQTITPQKFDNFCNNKCSPSYTNIKTPYNDPKISTKMKYASYVRQRTITKTIYGSQMNN